MNTQVTSATAPTVFQFQENLQLRVETDDSGEPLFCAKDVCTVLGYSNDRDAIARHCIAKGVVKRDTLTEGGTQQLTFISEGNLYRLIIKSNKPEAEKFKSWVCDDVLPTIRKTGQYAIQPPPYEKITDKQKQELYRAAQTVCDKFYWLQTSSATQWLINGVRVIFNLSDLADLPATQFDLAFNYINGKEAAIDEFRAAVCKMREEFYKTMLSGSAPWTSALKSKHTKAYKQKLSGQVNWQEVQQNLLGVANVN